MEALPDDVTVLVLSFLTASDLCSVSGVSRRLRTVAVSESLWANLLHGRLMSAVRPSLQGSRATYIAIEKGVNSLLSQFLKDTSEMQTALAKERQLQLSNLATRLAAKRSRKVSLPVSNTSLC